MISPSDMFNAKILIVDDKEANIRLLEHSLHGAGYVAVTSTTDSSEVIDLHREEHYDLILLDLNMPGMDGFGVMEALKEVEKDSYLPVLVITAQPDHKLRALKAGAKDFISKPLDLVEMLVRVHNMIEVRLLHQKTRRLYAQVLAEQQAQKLLESALEEAMVRVVHDVNAPTGTVAKSLLMRQLLDLASRVAQVDSTVLITGESGSGKERIARLVHQGSTRAAGPFIAVNCGAITETLLESELFGHTRGAFTGATQERLGLFEAANGGTLFLDEIGDVSPVMQVKLLRVLQERELRRVGENKTRKVDVRVVAATNRDLDYGVAGGVFRQDLYYRLKVVELHVPALRDRPDDILPLARVLLADTALRMKRKISGMSPGVADQLLRYHWPGNVRELENAMERVVALARTNTAELEDLPEEVRHALAKPVMATPLEVVRKLDDIERDYILRALELNRGNQRLTALQLDIGVATLHRKLKTYGLIPEK